MCSSDLDHVDHTGPSMAPSSFTGPTVYTDKGKMQKVPFDKIKDNKADYERRADDGWIAMVQHYFVGAWLRNEPGARAFDVSESPSKLVTLSMVTAFPTIAPGATSGVLVVRAQAAGARDGRRTVEATVIRTGEPGIAGVRLLAWREIR